MSCCSEGDVLSRLKAIEEKIDSLSARPVGLPVSWEDKQSDSGIQLTGGPTTVTRRGVILGTAVIPVGPSQASLMLIVKRDDDQISAVDASMCKFS